MTQEKLEEAIRLHKRWLDGATDGLKADLRNADLEGRHLRGNE